MAETYANNNNEAYDFSGKEVLAFCTHGGGGAGSNVETINKVLKAEKIKECKDSLR